jgi:hypothetical protein
MSADVMQMPELLADLAVKDIKVWVEGEATQKAERLT